MRIKLNQRSIDELLAVMEQLDCLSPTDTINHIIGEYYKSLTHNIPSTVIPKEEGINEHSIH